MRKRYSILVGKPKGKRPLVKSRCRCQDTIRMDFRKIGWEGVDWMHLAQNGDQWQAVVYTIMNLRDP